MSFVSHDSTNLTDSDASDHVSTSHPRYPAEAYEMISDGVSHAIRKVHGAETPAHRLLATYADEQELDWNDLARMYDSAELPQELVAAVEAAGGSEKLNRHISGQQLSWGLRDYALKRWGLMARTVMARWNIHETIDFGRIVFDAIETGRMRKQPGDTLDDFEAVYDFKEAFDEVYRIDDKQDDACDDDTVE